MNKKTGMIDVGEKETTVRIAKARATVRLNEKLVKMIKNNDMPKGNVIETARIAGIVAAKRTSELIPLCHNIELNRVGIDFFFKGKEIIVEAVAKAIAKTGVEMEVIVASSVAAITIYDMSKMFLRSIKITNIELIEKRGGKSGVYKTKR